MAGGTVSNKELYDALSGIDSKIDGTRKELKSDIIRVENKFDTMEAGRLSSVTIFNAGTGNYDVGSEVVVLGHD